MTKNWTNKKFTTSMLGSSTKTIGFYDLINGCHCNYALIHQPLNKNDSYYHIGKYENNTQFLKSFFDILNETKCRQVLSETLSVNRNKHPKYINWENAYSTLDCYMEEAIKKYADIPICIIYHEAWNTFDETVSIYI